MLGPGFFRDISMREFDFDVRVGKEEPPDVG